MKPDYRNWMPLWMNTASFTFTAALALSTGEIAKAAKKNNSAILKSAAVAAGLCTTASTCFTAWTAYCRYMYSYHCKRRLSKDIVDGTAVLVHLPEGGLGLDVGCGSGALTIACAKANPQAVMIGIDKWGIKYDGFNQKLCERNAEAEHIDNAGFRKGDARHLKFADETFDAVTSSYVFHNIHVDSPKERQQLILESLRVLKKGGTFAFTDIFSRHYYGDMHAFIQQLKDMGIQKVSLIDTTNGRFMNRREALSLMLSGSGLLVGKK